MTVVVKSSLIFDNKQASNIINAISKLNSAIDEINNFINESKSVLKGGGYDSLRIMLTYHVEFLSYAEKLYELVYEKILEANNGMIDYMGEYNRLDDSKLDVIKEQYNRVKSDLDEIELKNNAFDEIKKYYISMLQDNIRELESLISKLSNLGETDRNLASGFDDALDKLRAFNRKVNGLKVLEVDEFHK